MAATPGRRTGDEGFLHFRFWLIPVASLVGASILGILTTAIDRRLIRASVLEDLFARNPDAIRSALSVVASSILTFTALVFTITMVVVQQAANRFSPRLIRTFLSDRMSQVTLGTFMGTFAYALLVLRDVRSPVEGPDFVPGVSVMLVFVAVFVSLTLFVSYLSHVTNSLQVSTVVRRIAGETEEAAARLYAAKSGPDEDIDDRITGDPVTWGGRAGVLRDVDRDRLAEVAEDADCTVHVSVPIGEFVPRGTPILHVIGDESGLERNVALSALDVAPQREVGGDVAFGLRQLVDIAERALSPGVNDPTTAVQVIDQLHDLLANLAARDLSSAAIIRRRGRVRAVVPGPTWDDLVCLATEELQHYGADSIQVVRRLGAMLDDLAERVPDDRLEPIRRQRDLLAAARSELPVHAAAGVGTG